MSENFDLEKTGDHLSVSLSFLTGLTLDEIKPQIIAFGRRCEDAAYERATRIVRDEAALDAPPVGEYERGMHETGFLIYNKIRKLQSLPEVKA
jgi:hypothetical protein